MNVFVNAIVFKLAWLSALFGHRIARMDKERLIE